jgi:Papain-like cysteine protease AvrRpt2
MSELIEETSVPLSLPTTPEELPVGAPPPGSAPVDWKRIEFTVQHQLQTQWCWAAVSVSIADFYETPTAWTQCKLVSAQFGSNGCCDNGASEECNRPWYVDRALTSLGAFLGWERVTPSDFVASLLPSTVTADISAQRPVGVGIAWDGGGGHAIVIDGYQTDGAMVAVEDPWEGSADLPVSLLHRYLGTGRWVDTFRTQPPSQPTQPPA